MSIHDSSASLAAAAFDPFVQHTPRLLATARAILRSEDLARDAVQEALVSCWQQQRMPADPCAWMLRTVVHRALHHSRTRSRSRRHEGFAAGLRHECDESCDPAHERDRGELGALIAKALAALAPCSRRAFVLFELEGLDYAAVGARERIPIGTVRSRLARARIALRERLGKELAGDPWCLDCARERRRN